MKLLQLLIIALCF